MDAQTAVTTSYEFLQEELDREEADAYVHLGDRFDDSLRYLTRFNGPDRDYAFVYTDRTAVLCAPRLFGEQALREFAGGEIRTVEEQTATTAVGRVVEVLAELNAGSRVAVSKEVTHSQYRQLTEAGYEPVKTDSVRSARAVKTPAEREYLEAVHAVTQAGMARAESILAESTPSGGEVHWNGEPLTTERLRREINQLLVANGVNDAGNTVIGAGASCTDLHFTDNDVVAPNETILIDLSPRGPDGYYSDLSRTFVVGEVDEWTRGAYETVRTAQDAAFDALDNGAGTIASTVHETVSSVLKDDGFDVGYERDRGFYHGTGHGVGLSLHEAPILSAEEPLAAGNVVTVEPGVYNPDTGGIRIEDLVVVTERGWDNLTSYPRSLVPDPTRDPAEFLE